MVTFADLAIPMPRLPNVRHVWNALRRFDKTADVFILVGDTHYDITKVDMVESRYGGDRYVVLVATPNDSPHSLSRFL